MIILKINHEDRNVLRSIAKVRLIEASKSVEFKYQIRWIEAKTEYQEAAAFDVWLKSHLIA